MIAPCPTKNQSPHFYSIYSESGLTALIDHGEGFVPETDKCIVLEGQPIMLFNLREDPFELTNLVYLDQYNDQRERLQSILNKWINKTGDNFLMPGL